MLSDHESERQYLGACIADEGVLERQPLSPSDLEKHSHQRVLEAMHALMARKAPVDFIAIISELERTGHARAIGGADGVYASARSPEVPVETLRERLRELSALRRTREQLMHATVKCEAHDMASALEHVHRIADEARVSAHRKIFTAPALMQSAIDYLGLFKQDAPTKLVPTGIAAIDNEIGGMEPGDLFVFGAQTNVGKSWTALTCAVRIAEAGFRAGIISLEDPERLWGTRLLSVLSGLSSYSMRTRLHRSGEPLQREDYERISKAADRARTMGVELSISTGANVSQVIDTMRELVRERNCDVLFVDYAQCLYGVNTGNEHQNLKQMFTMIKSTAERLGVPLVLFSQIKRGDNPDREPTKYDLKEGGDLEIKATYVVMLWREQPGSNVIVGKVDKSKAEGTGIRFTFKQQQCGALVEGGAPAELAVPRTSKLYDIDSRRRK